MRTKTILLAFEDMKILYQYLYMDKTHVVIVHNSINVPLQLRMNDRGVVLCKNMNFPEFEEVDWTERMTIETVKGIVGQLKETPSEFPDSYKNRWEEIKFISNVNLLHKIDS